MEIMIVDDEPQVAEVLATSLQRQGHRTTVVHSGPEALDRIKGGAYDALFLETNPGPIKQLMADRKLIAPEARLPIVLPSRETCEKMRDLVAASTKRVAAVHDEGLFA